MGERNERAEFVYKVVIMMMSHGIKGRRKKRR